MKDSLENLPCIFDQDHVWDEFRTFDGEFINVSEKRLLEEIKKVIDQLGFCRVFEDTVGGRLWISGVGVDPDRRYIYYR